MNRHHSVVQFSHVWKLIEFFKRKQEAFASNCSKIAKAAIVSSKALRALYAVPYLVAKQKKLDTIDENLILTALMKVSPNNVTFQKGFFPKIYTLVKQYCFKKDSKHCERDCHVGC